MEAPRQPHRHDPLYFARNMAEAAGKAQRIFQGFLARQAQEAMSAPVDPLNVSAAFMDMYSQMLQNPAKLFEKQAELWKSYLDIWQHTTHKLLGEDSAAPVESDARDKRFKDPAWQESALFDF